MAKGGARPGAGRKPGQRNKITVDEKRSLTEIAGAYTSEAIETLAKIMRSPSTSASARVTAANSILDRGHGKARQPIEHDLNLENLTHDQLAALAIALGAHPTALVGLGGNSEAPVKH